MNTTTKKVFMEGMRDGLPIGLGYFAVSFSRRWGKEGFFSEIMEKRACRILRCYLGIDY